MAITFNPISKIQLTNLLPITFGQAPIASGQEESKLLAARNGDDIDIKKMAYYIRQAQDKSKLPDAEDIRAKFFNGELDPRKLKKGNKITLNLNGKDYQFEIEKDGEFACRVKGRDDSIRIYQGKDKYGRDCICLEHHYKKKECNIYVTFHSRIPVEKYDKKTKKTSEK